MKQYLTLAQLIGSRGVNNSTAFCKEVRTTYRYHLDGSDYVVNNRSVLPTADGGKTRWVGIHGRFEYEVLVDRGEVVTEDVVKEHRTVFSLGDLENSSGYEGNFVLVLSVKTTYRYYFSLPALDVNGSSVLTTADGNNSRWVGIEGRLSYINLENLSAGDVKIVGEHVDPFSARSSGGIVEIKDEGILVTSSAKSLNFTGIDIQALEDAPGEVIVYVPTVDFASHFNSSDGRTNAIVVNASTVSKNVSNPSSEGNPFKLGDWTAGTAHPSTNSATLNYVTPQVFSILDLATILTVNVYDANGSSVLATNNVTLDSDKTSVLNNIIIQVTNFGIDKIKYQAKVDISIDIDAILPEGGRFSIELEHDDEADGIFTKTQNNIFYDSNNNASSLSGVAVSEISAVTVQLDGVYYYTTGSQFQITIADIDYINNISYPADQVEITGSEYGLPILLIGETDFTGWTNAYNNQDSSYIKSDWTINAVNFSNISTTANVSGRTKDWVDGSWINSTNASILVYTYSDNSTRIFEDFRKGGGRLTTGFASWDDTQNLGSYDGGLGLLRLDSKLVYPQINFGSYAPNSGSQPDYSSLTGDRFFIGEFNHPSVSHSNGIFKLSGHNISEADLSANDVFIEISLDGIAWYILNNDYLGGVLSNGSGCRINSDTHALNINNQLQFTLGAGGFTNVSSGNGWGLFYKITYKDNVTGKSKSLDFIEMISWV
jgi:hypothetical protein